MKLIHIADTHLGISAFNRLDPDCGKNFRKKQIYNNFQMAIDEIIKQKPGSTSALHLPPAPPVNPIKKYPQHHRHHCRQRHALQMRQPDIDRRSRNPDNQNQRHEEKVPGQRQVGLRIDEHPDTRCRDDPKQQQRDRPHDGTRDRLDGCRDLAAERDRNRDHGSPRKDRGAVDPRDRQHADILRVRGVGRGAEHSRENRGDPFAEQRPFDPRVRHQVAADNGPRDFQVTNQFDKDHQRCRDDEDDGRQRKDRRVDGGKGEPGGRKNRVKDRPPEQDRNNIAGDKPEKDRDEPQEPPACRHAGNHDAKRQKNDTESGQVHRSGREPGHRGSSRCEFKADDRNDSSHGSIGKDDLHPADPGLFDHARQQDEQDP